MSAASPSNAQIRAQVGHLLKGDAAADMIGLRSRSRGTWAEEMTIEGRTFRLQWCESPLAVRQLLADAAARAISLQPESVDGISCCNNIDLEHDRAVDPTAPRSKPEGVVVLTPMSDETLGSDVVSRFARGRLLAIDSCEMLCAAFKARHLDARLRNKDWLADELLERVPAGGYPPVAGGVLDVETAWRHLLDRTIGIAEARPDAERLLEWTIEDGASERFASLSDKLKIEIPTYLASVSGDAGSLIIACVTAGHGPEALPLGLVCDVIFSERWPEGDLAAAAVRLESFICRRKVDSIAGRRWAEAATRLVSRQNSADSRRLLEHGDRLLQQLHVPQYAAVSRVLPSGFEARLIAHAHALDRAMGNRAAPMLEALEATGKAVRDHRMAGQEVARARRAEMASRLVRWLRTKTEDCHSFEQAATSYASEGGHVDWARRALMGGDEDPRVAQAYANVAAAVGECREQQNRAFAWLLRSWNASPSASSRLVPIEDVLTRVVAPLGQQRVPILLLVIDGMSFSVFEELSTRLDTLGWIELVPEGERGRLAAIAALPTLTETSRTSLLCGVLTRGNAQSEKTAFKNHPALLEASGRGKPPVVFHKSDLADASGLSGTVREAVADPGRRFVAVVLNAVDDYLSGSDQLHVTWSLDDIRVLPLLLREARDARRLVVITSDHGHVLEGGTRARAAGDGDRWRCPGGAVLDDEVELAGGRVLTPEGEPIAVMPWSERVRYAFRKNGYHGGVAPQEVVVPLCVVANDAGVTGWTEAPPRTPPWWSDTGDIGAKPAAAHHQQPVARRPEPIDLPLFRPAAPSRTEADWIDVLLASSAYANQKALAARGAPGDDKVRTILEGVRSRGGKLSKLALAQEAGVPMVRLQGLLSAVKRVINIDQSPILRIDEASGMVELNVELLRRQFVLGSDT